VTAEKTKRNDLPPEPADGPATVDPEVRDLEVRAAVAPTIRLAGYEDDPAENHILRGID